MQITITGKGQKALKLADGSFLGVKKPLTLDQFEKGHTYDVEIATNGRFKDIVSVKGTGVPLGPKQESAPAESSVQVRKATPAEVSKTLATSTAPRAFGRELSPYEVEKDRRISRAGIIQAVIQSPVYAQATSLMDTEDEKDTFLQKKAERWLAWL